MEQQAYSVGKIGLYVKQIFDAEEMLHNIRVYGEISEFKISQGNAWFTIKDENACLSCALFGAQYLSFVPKVGESVVLTGSVAFWQKSGKLSFVAKKIEHLGEGELYQKFIELKNKLQSEGLFEQSRKKAVPNNAINIGVATSETGAVMHDIIDVSTRRNPGVNIFIAPCKVQGAGADLTIIDALKVLDELNLDVLIIARGGGSREDLDCFNSEKLARFIATLKTPCVSAVGHETDFTICDFVADLRAPTPSASAELVVANVVGYKNELQLKVARLKNAVANYFRQVEQTLMLAKSSMQQSVKNKLNNYELKLNQNISTLNLSINHYLQTKTSKFEYLVNLLKKLNPLQILERGFCQATNEDGGILTSVDDCKVGDVVDLCFKDGNVKTQLQQITKKERKNGI